MIWNSESLFDWKSRMSKWHRYFAWYPVFLYRERKTAWFQTVERRMSSWSSYLQDADWEYRKARGNK